VSVSGTETYVCTVAGGKGGVGRTTATLNVATALQEKGYEVLVLEADLAMADICAVLDIEPDSYVNDVLQKRVTIKQAISGTDIGVDVLPANPSLDAFAETNPEQLGDVIAELREYSSYDIVLVDTPASVTNTILEPIKQTDGIVLVSTLDPISLQDSWRTLDLVDQTSCDVLGTVVTHVQEPVDVAEVRDTLDTLVYGAVPYYQPGPGSEPIVRTHADTDAIEEYRMIGTHIERIVFDGADPTQDQITTRTDWLESDTSVATGGDDDDGLVL